SFLDANTLDQTGTWALVFSPRSIDVGVATITAYLVTDQTFAITPNANGVATHVSVTTPGQNAVLSFAGTQGKKISAKVTGLSDFPDCYDLQLVRPDGSTLNTIGNCGSADAFLDAATLDQGGTWKLVFNPRSLDTGSGDVTAYLVADQTFTITPTPGGVAKAVSITTPGQNAVLSFAGSQGQKISAQVTGPSNFPNCYDLQLVRPDGQIVNSTANCGTGDAFLDATTLAQGGTWKIVFNP